MKLEPLILLILGFFLGVLVGHFLFPQHIQEKTIPILIESNESGEWWINLTLNQTKNVRFYDENGNELKFVRIGNQAWVKVNLTPNTTKTIYLYYVKPEPTDVSHRWRNFSMENMYICDCLCLDTKIKEGYSSEEIVDECCGKFQIR